MLTRMRAPSCQTMSRQAVEPSFVSMKPTCRFCWSTSRPATTSGSATAAMTRSVWRLAPTSATVKAETRKPAHEARVNVSSSAPTSDASASPSSAPFMLNLRRSETSSPSASEATSCSISA